MTQSTAFRKSSFCGNGACVEVALPGGEGGSVQMRDGKQADSKVLAWPAGAWLEFVEGVRAGEFGRP